MKILNVLKLGQSAKNPELLKRWQQRTNYIVGVFTSLSVAYNSLFPSHAIPSDIILPAAQVLGGLVVVINLILTAASSDKVGISGGTK